LNALCEYKRDDNNVHGDEVIVIMIIWKVLPLKASILSLSAPKHLESAAPKISALCYRKFVGMAANDPDCKIDPKAFHCEILKDHDTLKKNWTVTEDTEIICKLVLNGERIISKRNILNPTKLDSDK